MTTVVMLNKMGETPIYVYGWLSLIFLSVMAVSLISSIVLKVTDNIDLYWGLLLIAIAASMGMLTVITYLIGLTVEYQRQNNVEPLERYGIKQAYPEIPYRQK